MDTEDTRKTGFLSAHDLEINAVEALRRRRIEAGLHLYDLTSTNPTQHGHLFPPSILARAAEGYWPQRRYEPDPRGALPAREAIARYYVGRRACAIKPSDIVITASTSESYSLLFSLLADAGDNMLVPEPSYPLFELLAAARALELRSYHLQGEAWEMDVAALASLVDKKTRAIMVVSPHNPTGAIIRARDDRIAALGVPIIADEVFAEFTDGAPAPCLGTLYPDLPVFHLNGISKMLALPDLKLGWIALNERAEAAYGDRLEILNDCFLSTSGLIQHMLPVLLEQGVAFMRHMVESLRHSVAFVRSSLECLPRLHPGNPAGGYCVFTGVDKVPDEERLVLSLLHHGVLVHPGYFYGNNLGPHIMISCMPRRNELEAAVEIIAKMLQ